MAVYIDNALIKLERRSGRFYLMSHMTADTLEELDAMADKLGMKREWFQDTKHPHYDVTKQNREKALKLGAIPVSTREILTIARKLKNDSL